MISLYFAAKGGREVMVRLPTLSNRAHIPNREAARPFPEDLGSSAPHTDDPQSYAEISHVNLMRGTTFEKDPHQDRAAFHHEPQANPIW